MTSQPPQDEVEEVARAICGPNCDAPTCSCQPTELAKQICWQTELDRAHVAIATIDHLRRAAPADEWSFDMDAAPKDEWLWVWCPAVEGLAPLLSLCLWHSDAGFCVDEIRTPVCWTRVQQPSPPKEPVGEKDISVAAGAAPLTKELLSRLCEAVDYVEDAARGWPGGSLEREVAVSVFDRCQTAIAKATAAVEEAAEPVRRESKASEPVPLPTPPKDETHG